MVFVLGVAALLAITVALLFDSVRRSNALVSRSFNDLQGVLAGRSAFSYAVARLQGDPSLVEGWNVEWRDRDDSDGFRLHVAMRGVFPRGFATPLGDTVSRHAGEADFARVWITEASPALILWASGDVVPVGGAEIRGAIYSPGRGGGRDRNALRYHDLDEAPEWIRNGIDTTSVGRWQGRAELAYSGAAVLPGETLGRRLNPGPTATLVLGDGVWILGNHAVYDSLVCDGCVLLSNDMTVRKRIRLRDGVIWSRGSLRIRGDVLGDGQVLSRDTLDMDSVTVEGCGVVFAAIGREQLDQGELPTGRSTACLRMRQVRGGGTAITFSCGRGSSDRAPVLMSDSATRWKGDVLANGVVRWRGILDRGALFADRLIGVRPDGVVQDGGLEGRLYGASGRTRLSLPWSEAGSGLVGIASWNFHAVP